jgi:hypothetical protein
VSINRTGSQPANTPPAPQIKGDGVQTQDTDVQPPYTEYEKEFKHPYLVEHFGLGDSWQDKFGGFDNDIRTIDNYLKNKIEQGELKNDVESVKEKIKSIYKLCGIDKNERVTMQIEKLSAYIDFLKKTDHIKLNHQKYGRQNI